jgi:thiol-disulfide isomerase/thioredoxin
MVASVVLMACAGKAGAQPATEDAPEGIFVDLVPRSDWGPFIPRSGYSDQHFVGSFTLQGRSYRLFLLRHDERNVEDRVLIEPADSDVAASEGEGMSVFYRYESVDFNGLTYDIMGVSPASDQFVLTRKEDVSYAEVGLRSGESWPSFEATSLSGSRLTNAGLGNSYVLIHFWGTWCGPCHGEIPFLVEAHERFGDQIQFVGVAVDDDEQAVRQYVAEHGLTWPQVLIPNDYPNTDELVSSFGVRGYPTQYLIDPDGSVVVGAEQRMRLRGSRLLETLTRITYDPDVFD